jgi:hypothetical protein
MEVLILKTSRRVKNSALDLYPIFLIGFYSFYLKSVCLIGMQIRYTEKYR